MLDEVVSKRSRNSCCVESDDTVDQDSDQFYRIIFIDSDVYLAYGTSCLVNDVALMCYGNYGKYQKLT